MILYVLLSGTPPFSEDRTCGRDLKGQILTANFKFYPVLWDRVSADAKDLITKLLKDAITTIRLNYLNQMTTIHLLIIHIRKIAKRLAMNVK